MDRRPVRGRVVRRRDTLGLALPAVALDAPVRRVQVGLAHPAAAIELEVSRPVDGYAEIKNRRDKFSFFNSLILKSIFFLLQNNTNSFKSEV
ncbi:MAG: hypothetical protein Q8807_03260 ['Waltheria sp.' little leaf phytoplasma]|nr:hypothetical protein ['Waltheria sp.' little leaf phytoplasma]